MHTCRETTSFMARAPRAKSVPQRHPGCENRILPHGGGRVTGKLEIRKQKLEGGVDGGGRKLETRKQKVEGGGMGGMT